MMPWIRPAFCLALSLSLGASALDLLPEPEPGSAAAEAAAKAAPVVLKPFGAASGSTPELRAISKAPYVLDLDVLGPAHAAGWQPTGMQRSYDARLFAMAKDGGREREVMRLNAAAFEPGATILNYTLPDAQNGDTWKRYGAATITVVCRAVGAPGEAAGAAAPTQLDVHLTLRGKTPGGSGSYRATVPVATGEWQRITLPFQQFGMKDGGRVGDLGFGFPAGVARDAAGDGKGTGDVEIAGVRIEGAAYDETSWKTHGYGFGLAGEWRFALDPDDGGLARGWQAAGFDDAAWGTLKTGVNWRDEGIDHNGWGWYRQQFLVPAAMAGAPMQLDLAEIPYDDEVWVNGVRVGGEHGNYKYAEYLARHYVVPAEVLRTDAPNSIAIRTWGVGREGSEGSRMGLPSGTYRAEIDPYGLRFRPAGGDAAAEVSPQHFDVTACQQGMPFEIVALYPGALLGGGAASAGGAGGAAVTADYVVADLYGGRIAAGQVPVTVGADGKGRAVISVGGAAAEAVYLRGRLAVYLTLRDAAGALLAASELREERLCYAARDTLVLPALPETWHDTPYGRLRLVDEIDAAQPASADPHPFIASGFDSEQRRHAPGSPLAMPVREILGRQAREPGYGWFAYRLGRGGLKPRGAYLVRIEYPEDKRRYAPVEISSGHTFMDIGWKNGIAPDDPYDNWPLSGEWQWYDSMVVLGDETTGESGAGGASTEAGVWVYLMNKMKPGTYFQMYEGGPAVARIRLYEIDQVANAPVIRRPAGLPARTLMMDWERQPDHVPADAVNYCRLMGYSAVSPVILKWGFMNWGEPMVGYDSCNVDSHGYHLRRRYEEGSGTSPGAALAGVASIHQQYLDATRALGVDYLPRFEYGGSTDLPPAARAIGADGEFAKPNRFASWSANLLHPATWDDLAATVDALVKPYAAANPQLKGLLWRIRQDRMQISYGRADIALFAQETGVAIPPQLVGAALSAWAAGGEVGERYADWWHAKRRDFHARLAARLQSYRADLRLLYFNWDNDKFWLGLDDTNSSMWFRMTVETRAGERDALYAWNLRKRRKLTGEDYVHMIRTGALGDDSGWGADYGLRAELYRDVPGIELFAPANYLYLADNPVYLNAFRSHEGLAVSNTVSYDEMASRYIHPRYETNMMTPANGAFSMALELLAWFHGDARTLSWTAYSYGRGFADAHRRFAQAFLALPAIDGVLVPSPNPDVCIRRYPGPDADYVGVAHKGYAPAALTVRLPGTWTAGTVVTDQVSGQPVAARLVDGALQWDIAAAPMSLHAYRLAPPAP